MVNYINFKEIIRSFRRNLSTNILSLLGLSIGLAVALLIGFWSLNEFSFDNFHKDADNIYRICRKGFLNNETVMIGSDFGPVATTAKDELPEIKEITRVRTFTRELIKIKDDTYYEDQIITTDKNFFQFLSFKLETGDPSTCLDGPDKIVIDREMANKYFTGENAVGQMIQIFGKQFQVSAIMENLPKNSHIRFHIVFPLNALDWLIGDKWGDNDNYIAYVKLKEKTDIDELGSKISQITYKHMPVYEQYKITHFLQPMSDIHFSTGFRFDSVITYDKRMVFIFITIAILILSIACFNFINLFISTSFQRAKAIGIKKINGISGAGIFISSFAETALYILIATIMAFIIAIMALPFFNQLTGSELSLDFNNYKLYLYTGILMLFTIIAAGIFPVLYILRFNPQEIIRSKFKGAGITLLQRTLVVSQFAASIVLISSTVIIKKQLHFIQNKDLGFEKSQVICFQPRNMAGSYESVRQELLRNPSIIDVTAKSCLPKDWNNGNPITTDDHPDNDIIAEICQISYNYANMMSIPLVDGTNPFKSGESNSDKCLINEKTLSVLELENPIGKQINLMDGKKVTIAGVLKNANTKSLHTQIDPQIYVSINELQGWHYMMVKSLPDSKKTIKILTETWNKYNPDFPFEYTFLDDTYNQLYISEKTASKTVSAGMAIALFLAFMGLFAMAHYATEKRIKEIGVRKVNGASLSEILVLLNRDFVKWVILAFVIAFPLALFAMAKWLDNFAYKTELSWWIFALAGLLALAVSLLTVSFQSWKAATKNPVESLRYE